MVADPERRLALAYAPAHARPAIETLWLIDERMGAIVAAAREPAIGAMRLIWWRDALAALDQREAPAEPLLARVSAALLPTGIAGSDVSAIEEGWSALLDGETPDEEMMRLHASRGAVLFALAARALRADASDVTTAGEGWALADLGHRISVAAPAAQARGMAAERLATVNPHRWPRALRALGLLTLLATRDAGTEERRQGSPARVLRGALYGLTGL
ncbi:hypothetical protein FYJ91_13610 [Sphingomonas montanisoli]|uniref:Phytoene synthase n=1 Tax=Sphingomonas montanisoli TaxID=2606412 RepID=A0A5D9C993_9SPHN|nr:hypothetical protein FYJ91_13610 [Sphingomonas montanisoli]